ncbi:M48 family peptidase [Mariprofundus sp. EBB-1]|uniref:YgjP-like metallopeptidase domain-containing protein n=1 Tax=Mariprofundus sp. EBB-1 TaxID=2650971 RepID=UPI000EF2615B|nr:YgjP-like metallopeptidase domain-containing protein [Mariprofundus sp. EBB-1]RLL52214.1 M48 family peptidase [Mariprofundus sp. EBB-1]
MLPKPPPDYLAGYPAEQTENITQQIEQGLLAEELLQKYPQTHTVRTNKALYAYVMEIKNSHLRKSEQLDRVAFDSKPHITHKALGLHAHKSRLQGASLRAKREVIVSTLFKDMPPEFLRMMVVHELAHLKSREHDKGFYQLCCNMEPDYHELEFDLRSYLTLLEITNKPLWSSLS